MRLASRFFCTQHHLKVSSACAIARATTSSKKCQNTNLKIGKCSKKKFRPTDVGRNFSFSAIAVDFSVFTSEKSKHLVSAHSLLSTSYGLLFTSSSRREHQQHPWQRRQHPRCFQHSCSGKHPGLPSRRQSTWQCNIRYNSLPSNNHQRQIHL